MARKKQKCDYNGCNNDAVASGLVFDGGQFFYRNFCKKHKYLLKEKEDYF